MIDNRHTTLKGIDMDKLNGLLGMHPEDKVVVLSGATFENVGVGLFSCKGLKLSDTNDRRRRHWRGC